MTPTDLGNKPASEMTYRQAIVLALLPDWVRGCHSPSAIQCAWENCNNIVGHILAREAQEAGDERG